MKRTAFVISLALVLVLSFSAIAGAKYAGANLLGQAGATAHPARPGMNGYLAWDTAIAIMDDTDSLNAGPSFNYTIPWILYDKTPGEEIAPTAHGGYVTATTKCVVCHSVHRANAITDAGAAFTGIGQSSPRGYLTGALSSCQNCHVAMSSIDSPKPVEWPDPDIAGNVPDQGAHGAANRGCVVCHKGRVHGGGGSKYFGMNAYMLGNDADSDDNINKELELNGGASAKGITDWFLGQAGDGNSYGVANNSFSTAFMNGTAITNAQMAAGKANAAGYTCSRTGCHGNGMFGVNKWGFAAVRNNGTGATAVSLTGHRIVPGAGTNNPALITTGNYCGPCHPGNMVGGFRSESYLTTDATTKRATAYGCDQCHDAIGEKTMTTAWPHGTSNLNIYEWVQPDTLNMIGPKSTVLAKGTNLWMYQGNAAGYGAPNRRELLFDPQFTFIEGAVTGQSGSTTIGTSGRIRDGVCLKCHVPYDPKSLEALSMFVGVPGTYNFGIGDLMAGMHKPGDGIDIPAQNLAPGAPFGAWDSVRNLEPDGVDMSHLIWTYR